METLHYFDEIEPLDARLVPGASSPGRDFRNWETRTIEMLKSYVEDLSTREDQDELFPHVRGALLRTMFALDHLRGVPVPEETPADLAARAEDLNVGSYVT